ncbi:hypothetical protein [Mariniradius saccharolyticus]|uniref:hypothetical protein n=1 Tax=Mariniradius saccharolyticus TaxID=1245591 RepID=UPI001B7F82D9|nr:hypothetical protein [Mariniradius saccharolyticus]
MFLNINTANAQLDNLDLDRSWIKNKKTARKAYIKCVGDGLNESIFVRLDSKKLEFLPIASFEFSKTLLNDEIEKDIVDHLVPSSGFPISSVIVLNEKNTTPIWLSMKAQKSENFDLSVLTAIQKSLDPTTMTGLCMMD